MRRPALLLVCTGCTLSVDVVAHGPGPTGPVDAQTNHVAADGGAELASAPDAASRCAPRTNDLLVVSKAGELSRFDPDAAAAEVLGSPACLRVGVLAATLDQSGAIWASTRDGHGYYVTLDDLACRQLTWSVTPSALSFVYDPISGGERLYAVDSGRLFEIDLNSLQANQIGTLSADVLAGQDQGTLFAFSAQSSAVDVARVDSSDATVTSVSKVTTPVSGGFAGAAFWQGRAVLLFGSVLYSDAFEAGGPSFLAQLPGDIDAYAGLVVSECATSLK